MSEQSKKDIRKLRTLNFDLANYFSNTIIPQLFVDAEMVLRIFTPPAMEQFSLSYEDIGKNIQHVRDNIRYPTIADDIQEVITTSQIFEKEIQTTDGNWFQMNIVPYVEHELDRINGVIITFVNITKRLTTIKELEKINAEHHVLMFALAHDVKQPISTLKLITAGLLETYKRQDREQFLLMLKRLQTTSEGFSTLIEEFTSSGEEYLQQENAKQLDIPDICKDVLDALRGDIENYNILIIKNFQTSKIVFPKNSLRSIIYNLLHNAIKYRDRNNASVIEITTSKTKDFVVLSVEDNGLGIAEEHQEKVFKKSSRINKKIEGTGMGLYIIKKMIESHGGKIELESTLGKGSKFIAFFKRNTSEN